MTRHRRKQVSEQRDLADTDLEDVERPDNEQSTEDWDPSPETVRRLYPDEHTAEAKSQEDLGRENREDMAARERQASEGQVELLGAEISDSNSPTKIERSAHVGRMMENKREIRPVSWRPSAEIEGQGDRSEHINEAYEAARQALVDHGINEDRLIEARRYTSEAAARTTIGQDATDLDVAARKLSMRGNNYPTYDVSSRREVASVKTHWSSEGELQDAALAAYRSDFSHMQGWGRSEDALEHDARNIIAARDSGVPVPEDLTLASESEAARYLRDHSVLRIPDDHVQEVQTSLAADARALPSNYFLSDHPSDADITRITERVRGIGVTSDDLREITERRRDRRHGE